VRVGCREISEADDFKEEDCRYDLERRIDLAGSLNFVPLVRRKISVNSDARHFILQSSEDFV